VLPSTPEPTRTRRSGLSLVRRARRFIARAIRAAAILARDGRIPKPLRSFAALALVPVPGPFDEAVLLVVAVPLFVFYRGPMREAWANVRTCSTAN
jgi:hypothetical protein